MQASGLSGVAVRDTSLGCDVGAALAVRAAANSTAPAPERPADQDHGAAPEPADDPAAGLVIEHHQQGTLVHGTEKNDQQLRRLLRRARVPLVPQPERLVPPQALDLQHPQTGASAA